MAGFGRSEAARALATYRRVESFREALTGTRTNTGVLVREVALHLTARAAQRGVEQESIVDALTSPLKTGSIRADGSQQFIGERATVSVNVETGKIITVWPTSTKKAERFKGGK